MNAKWQRYGELLVTFERYLSLMGIWPGKSSRITRTVVFAILLGFCVALVVKTITHPESGSIENGVAVGLGGIMFSLLLARIIFNEERFCEVIDFIKEDLKRTPSDIEKEILTDIGKEIELILKFVTFMFPAAVIGKLFMPFVSFAYELIMRYEDASIKLPPAMALPPLPFGIYGEIAVYLMECIVRMVMLFYLLGGAIFFVVATLFISGQFRTLAKEFEDISLDNVALFDSFIKRHELIISKAKMWTNLFSTHFFVESVVSYINLAIMLLSMTSGSVDINSFLNDMTLTGAGMTQFAMILIYGGHIRECSLLVYMGAYHCDWIGKPVPQQKKLMLVLKRGQKPTSLCIYDNFAVASVEFLTDIIRNSYAAFNLLRKSID